MAEAAAERRPSGSTRHAHHTVHGVSFSTRGSPKLLSFLSLFIRSVESIAELVYLVRARNEMQWPLGDDSISHFDTNERSVAFDVFFLM